MKMALQQTGAARRNSEPTVGFGSLRRVASAANEGMPFRNLIPGKGEDPAMFLTHVPKHESSSREFLILLTSYMASRRTTDGARGAGPFVQPITQRYYPTHQF